MIVTAVNGKQSMHTQAVSTRHPPAVSGAVQLVLSIRKDVRQGLTSIADPFQIVVTQHNWTARVADLLCLQ